MDKDYKNFCIIPFISLHGKFTLERYRPCCEWQGGFNGEYSSIEDLWNGKEFQDIRDQFNKRQMPKQCSVCVADEKSNLFSKRQYHNSEYLDQVKYYTNNHKTIVDTPIYWDLRPSNICNLECVMCDTKNSSSISSRVYTWKKSFKLTKEQDKMLGKIHGQKQEDSYFEYMKENVNNVREILFAGGEPFLMPEVLHLLEWLTENNHSKNIKLRILTNGTVFRSKWMDMLKSFKKLVLLISLDGVEEIVEYARYPNKWSLLERNVVKYNELNKEPNCKVALNPCIHIMNFIGLHKLFKFAKQHDIHISPTLVYKAQDYDYLHVSRIKTDIYHNELEKCRSVLRDWQKGKDSFEFIDNISKIKFSIGKNNKQFQTYIHYLDSHRPIKFLEQYPYFDYLMVDTKTNIS